MNYEHLAAIDIGTNSFHLVIVRVNQRGEFEIVSREKEVVRLGSGAGDLEHITPEAVQRGIDTLKRFVQIANNRDARIKAVATSAVREAKNRDVFLERVENECGLQVEVISGVEEARLIYLGVLQALPIYEKKILMVDIGGGSTEFLLGLRGEPLIATSLKLGAIRLMDRFFRTEPIRAEQILEARNFIQVSLSNIRQEILESKLEMAVGSSGTVETIARIVSPDGEPGDLFNTELTAAQVDLAVAKILSFPTHAKRAKLTGLDEKRSDIIVSGAILLQEIFRAFRIEKMRLSPYALREGVILDSLSRKYGVMGRLPDIRKSSVDRMMHRFLREWPHEIASSRHAALLCISMYDELNRLKLIANNPEELFLLETAALLHNIGIIVSHSAHHKHSYYIIKNSDDLLGFTRDEIDTIALVSRYHRKTSPSKKHTEFMSLPIEHRNRVRLLSAILRIAVGLDRSTKGYVEGVRMEHSPGVLRIIGTGGHQGDGTHRDISLEIWAAELRKSLLEEILHLRVEILTEDQAAAGIQGNTGSP